MSLAAQFLEFDSGGAGASSGTHKDMRTNFRIADAKVGPVETNFGLAQGSQ